ncbi:dihydroorotate dehydrogenase (quinone), mitochondrial [Chelonus insularis]|uniref:dihydroorotate dehydrogenase (quinone), mitochondrial n=1 Tax=Chelonus insularis TaxID=460826 RepID=UPI00158EA1CC|nr:dihydroorotate dehydrogenase (quinone), mitochondrial [Chelonus insularis]XP_034935976.1 dihydroorotate dehydrogenase (quinone), mitochondrial [Chelonus insularis]
MASKLSNKQKIRSFLMISFGGASLFTGMSIFQGNEKFYDQVVMRLIKSIDPEIAHKMAVTAAKWEIIPKQKTPDPVTLKQNVWGLEFNNPLGMAAGFDKQAEAVRGLIKSGFGFVEIGSVTPIPQVGNPKPRVFRLSEDKAVINRYGFNSDGHEIVRSRIAMLKQDPNFHGIVGVNLGKNKTSTDPVNDYVEGLKKFNDIADYLVINVSSPNTEGLRDLQAKKHLEVLLTEVNTVRNSINSKVPLLLKLAPDLTQTEKKDIVDVIQKKKCKVDGLILSNTTIKRENLKDPYKNEKGGLSGAPLTDLSTSFIADMFKLTEGKIPIIGVGGIFSGQDAFDKINAGASLIQIYTSYTYHGPPVVQKIKRELNDLLESNGYSSVADAVGKGNN